jgi:hypothetical protein
MLKYLHIPTIQEQKYNNGNSNQKVKLRKLTSKEAILNKTVMMTQNFLLVNLMSLHFLKH